MQTQGRNGTIVAPRLEDAERHRRALALTQEYVAAMTALGVPRAEVTDYLGRA